jgi:hypothetical protein
MDAIPQEPPEPPAVVRIPSRREMTEEKRMDVYCWLLARSINGVLLRGEIKRASVEFNLDDSSLARFWKQARANIEMGLSIAQAVLSKRGQRHCFPKYVASDIANDLAEIPKNQRKTFRDAAKHLGIAVTTFYKTFKGNPDLFRRHRSQLKPTLSEENMVSRLVYALDKVGDNGLFQDMYDEIHIDEKWFYLTEACASYILTCDEDNPIRTTRNRNHIEKVMFLCAVARPRMNPLTGQMFDGKIGAWPIGDFGEAIRNSVHRPRGAEVWRNESMTRIKYKDMLINQVLPAILEKFPYEQGRTIILQQDNASSHCDHRDPNIAEALTRLGLDLKIKYQPANSPDTSTPRRFFDPYKSDQWRTTSYNSTELIQAVTAAFENYPWEKLNNAFLTLQGCCNCIIDVRGDNNYSIPHMNKKGLIRIRQLPVSIRVTDTTDLLP